MPEKNPPCPSGRQHWPSGALQCGEVPEGEARFAADTAEGLYNLRGGKGERPRARRAPLLSAVGAATAVAAMAERTTKSGVNCIMEAVFYAYGAESDEAERVYGRSAIPGKKANAV